MTQERVVISQLINHAEVDVVGGIWTDQEGKIHYVGITVTECGVVMPDFPNMKDVYIADVAQVGLKRELRTTPTNTKERCKE